MVFLKNISLLNISIFITHIKIETRRRNNYIYLIHNDEVLHYITLYIKLVHKFVLTVNISKSCNSHVHLFTKKILL